MNFSHAPRAASDTSARAALAQSTSFCTVGAPLTPIAPTISPSTLMGNPPPHAATRASVGTPAKSDGSPLIKLKNSCVETPNRAVYALFCAISMVGMGAPSIPLKALRLPPSSRIATFSLTPISLAFATAASTIFCASLEERVCFFSRWAIAHLPSLAMYCLLFIPDFAHLRCPSLSCTITLPRWPFPLHRRLNLRSSIASGIHSAVHGKIRAGNVRGLRSGDKRHHRGDLIHTPVTIKRCGGLLRHRPITRGGIQFRVDWARLHVVDRDASAPDLSGQRLSEHLDGSLRPRVRHKPGRRDTFADGRTHRDDATAALHVLQRRLSRDVHAPNADVEHAIHLFQRRLLDRLL